MVFPWIAFLKESKKRLSDLEFLAIKEYDGKLIHLISSEFTGNADQITYTPASGKTFYLLRCKLYPVVDTVLTGSGVTATNANRRVDVEITLDGTVVDVLTHDYETSYGNSSTATASGLAANTGQYESNIVESLEGNGSKTVKLTSTNTSGTYRVSMLGIIEDTGSSPQV